MCGIAGLIAGTQPSAAVDRMIAQMHHRGPDDRGTQSIALGPRKVVLGSTRLAILDLSPAGHMPMRDPETGNWIVYNGEVYNFADLRRELEAKDGPFRSRTDTEVILRAYGRWGAPCVQRFRGMFAFAIWDASRQELFLARDRAGKKPLYYAQPVPGTFVFASEVRALMDSGLVERRLAPEALEVYLYNGFSVSPLTMIKGVCALLPAHWMRVGLNGAIRENRRYWRPSLGTASCRPLLDQARFHLEDAVRLRMMSDVPLGAFLSGGLDSSTVVALMARSGQDVRTFSVTFDEAEYDESRFARWVADRFRTRHTDIRLRRQDFRAWLPAALAAMDQPTLDGVNTYCVSRAAREGGLTVALSGIGGDELFGGYPFFRVVPRVSWLAGAVGRLPQPLVQAIEGLPARRPYQTIGAQKTLEFLRYGGEAHTRNQDLLAAYQATSMLLPYWSRRSLLADGCEAESRIWFGLPIDFVHFLQEETCDDGAAGVVSHYALRLFLGERCLRDSDMMSMSVSLELRAPFTDPLFVESIYSIPSRLRCSGIPDKPFEWEMVKPYLGETYPYRKKQGFTFPLNVWLQDAGFRGDMQAVFGDEELVKRSGLRPRGVRELAASFWQPRPGTTWLAVWSLFVLLSWCRENRVTLA